MLVIIFITIPIALADLSNSVGIHIHLFGLIAAALIVASQAASIAFLKWRMQRGRPTPDWFGPVTVIIECIIPTAAIIANIQSRTLAPYAALMSPALVAYGMLIIMTALRLRPALCVLAGAISSLGYLGVVVHTMFVLRLEPSFGHPRPAYFVAPLLIFATGLAAAWVAFEIRAHVLAAVNEAETRRKMERIEHDLSIASSIQKALIPRQAPSIPGFEVAGWNRPADQTGGDYFDWHMHPDGYWIVTLADVSGHGVGPALITAACRAYVRASTSHHSDLASLTTRINGLLAADLPEGRFVTMACVLIDPKSPNSVSVLSAGHGPIVLRVSGSGELRDLMPQDHPLAIDAEHVFGPSMTVPLAPGDLIALVTDGFTEWTRTLADGRSEQFGIDRLRESLSRHAQKAPEQIIQSIASDAADFAGHIAQQDDLTMVIIRRAS